MKKQAELTGSDKAFINAYIELHDLKQAATAAGLKEKQGAALMKKPLVKAEIDRLETELTQRVLDKVEIDDVYVLKTAHEMVERCMSARPYLDRRGEQIKDAEGKKLFVFDPSNVARGLEIIGKHRRIRAFEEPKAGDKTGGGGGLSVNMIMFIVNHCNSTRPEKKILPA